MFTVCLAILAAAGPAVGTAAESAAPTQDLVKPKALDNVVDARWTRQPDAYVLRVVLDTAKPVRNAMSARLSPFRLAPAVNAAEPQQPLEPYVPVLTGTAERGDRGSFFIGKTVADMRGMDPTFCGRRLTLVDGRRVIGDSAQQPPPPRAQPQPRTPVIQPYALATREPRVEAWLLKADGTQIMPATYICDPGPRDPDVKPKYDISYGFTAADGAQAVAAAIRVDGDFFIEMLQPLEPQPAAR
jgi:hypothetical protein